MSTPVEFFRTTWRRRRRPIHELFGSDRWSHLALNNLDHKLKKYLDFENGSFIEAGGNDGLSQSNTYWFERFRGWRGMLIEAVPEQAQLCRRNRPRAEVVNTALVADQATESVRIKAAKLMAFIPGTRTQEAGRHASAPCHECPGYEGRVGDRGTGHHLGIHSRQARRPAHRLLFPGRGRI